MLRRASFRRFAAYSRLAECSQTPRLASGMPMSPWRLPRAGRRIARSVLEGTGEKGAAAQPLRYGRRRRSVRSSRVQVPPIHRTAASVGCHQEAAFTT